MSKNNDFTINETFTLPSKGLVYDDNFPATFTIRSMTTQEEMKRLSHSDLPYKNICEIMDDCIVSNFPMSCYDLCMSDYKYVLYMLRVVTYGPKYNITSTCPYCGCSNEEIADISLLEVKDYTEDVNKYLRFELPKTKKMIELYLTTPRMVDTAQYNVKEYRKKSGKNIDMTTIFTIQEAIKSIDGKAPDVLKVTDWIRNLPMMDTNTILAYMEKVNNMFGIVNNLRLMCDVCGLEYNTSLRADREFFRPKVEI